MNHLARARLLMPYLLIVSLFSAPSYSRQRNIGTKQAMNSMTQVPNHEAVKQQFYEKKMTENMKDCVVNGKTIGNKPGAKHVRLRKIRDKIITKKTQAHLLKERLIGEYVRRYRLKRRGYFLAVKSGNANDPSVWGGRCPTKTDHVHMGKYKIDWQNTGEYDEPKTDKGNVQLVVLIIISIVVSLYLMFPVPLFMIGIGAVRTSVGSGAWDVAGTWDTGVPIPGTDTAVINGHTVTILTGTTAGAGTGAANTVAITINDSVTSSLVQEGNSTLQLYGYISKLGRGTCIHNADVNGVCTIHVKSSLSTSPIWLQTVVNAMTNYSISYYVSFVGTSAVSPNILTADAGITVQTVYLGAGSFSYKPCYFISKFISDTTPIAHTYFLHADAGNYLYYRHDAESIVFSTNPTYFLRFRGTGLNCAFITYSNLTITTTTSAISWGDVYTSIVNSGYSSTGTHSTITNCIFTNNSTTVGTIGDMSNYNNLQYSQTLDITNSSFINSANGPCIEDVCVQGPTQSDYNSSLGNFNYYGCTFTKGAGADTKISICRSSHIKHTFYGCSLAKTDVTFVAGGAANGLAYVLLKSKLAPTIVDTASAPIQDVWVAAIPGVQDGTTLTPYDTCDDFTLNTGLTNPIYLGTAKAPNSTGVWVNWCAVGTEAYITLDKSPYNQYSTDAGAHWVDIGTPIRAAMLTDYTTTIMVRQLIPELNGLFSTMGLRT